MSTHTFTCQCGAKSPRLSSRASAYDWHARHLREECAARRASLASGKSGHDIGAARRAHSGHPSTKRTFLVYPQTQGMRDCLRRSLAAALERSPGTLPRPNYQVAGNWLEEYNERLADEAGVALEIVPSTWRPYSEDSTWIACLGTLDAERGHAVTMLGTRLLFDPDGEREILPSHLHRFSLRIHRLATL